MNKILVEVLIIENMAKKNTEDEEESEVKQYGVVLKKEKKLRHRIYPQKGKVPEEEDTDSYKIV